MVADQKFFTLKKPHLTLLPLFHLMVLLTLILEYFFGSFGRCRQPEREKTCRQLALTLPHTVHRSGVRRVRTTSPIFSSTRALVSPRVHIFVWYHCSCGNLNGNYHYRERRQFEWEILLQRLRQFKGEQSSERKVASKYFLSNYPLSPNMERRL